MFSLMFRPFWQPFQAPLLPHNVAYYGHVVSGGYFCGFRGYAPSFVERGSHHLSGGWVTNHPISRQSRLSFLLALPALVQPLYGS